jgi:tRNA pseudouridine(55) synthase
VDYENLHGLILVDKPPLLSSADVTNAIKDMLKDSGLNKKNVPKVGHGGTLDPFATGLLVVLLGHGVRFATAHLGGEKTYDGIIRFGEKTQTGDHTSEVVATGNLVSDFNALQQAADTFCNAPYHQTPPMHSAKKIAGKRLFELAREGKVIERDSVVCQIKNFQLTPLNEKEVGFQVTCSAGTFVRVLAEDLAEKMSTVSHLQSLRRTKSKNKSLEQAWSLDQLSQYLKQGKCWTQSPVFFPVEDLVKDLYSFQCDNIAAASIRAGRNDILRHVQYCVPAEVQRVAMMIGERLLAVVVRTQQGHWIYEKVLHSR